MTQSTDTAAQLDVHIADLIIATHDAADPQVHPKMRDALRLLRAQLGMDAVFVSRNMAGTLAGRCGLVEASWCEYVARHRLGDLPFDTGVFASASIALEGGLVYGTLGCVGQDAQRASGKHAHWLELTARLLAEELGSAPPHATRKAAQASRSRSRVAPRGAPACDADKAPDAADRAPVARA
jgi:hypothetical protein